MEPDLKARLSSIKKDLTRGLEEAIYLLLVKASTFPVWLSKFNPRLERSGTVIVNIFTATELSGESLYQSLTNYSSSLDDLKVDVDYGGQEISKFQKKFGLLCQRRQAHLQDCHYIETFIQLDIYCSKDEGVALDEAEYINHQIRQIFLDNPLLEDRYRVFLYERNGIRDNTDYPGMAPPGFQRVTMDISFIFAKTDS
jgi:hypothetical protein